MYIYIYIYINIYIYIYIYNIYTYIHTYKLCCFLFFLTLSQHIDTMITLVSHSHDLFQLLLLDRCH